MISKITIQPENENEVTAIVNAVRNKMLIDKAKESQECLD
jgi:hypothetical protein